jgi:hypothetical protein
VNLGYSGAATQGVDYTVSTTSIVIPAGQLSGTATVTALQDSLDEFNEGVFVDIVSIAAGRESGVQRRFTTIIDDDAAPTVTLARSTPSIAEASGTSTVTASLSAVSGVPVTVALGFSGTATLGTDYTASDRIVIPAGQLTGSMTVTALQDPNDEANESVVVDIANVLGGTELGTQTAVVSILDDDLPARVTLSSNRTSINEAGGVATITATLSEPSAFTVIVRLGFAGTANHLDIAASALRIVILPGQLSGSITVTARQDSIDEPTETFTVGIIGVTNGSESGNQSVTVSILDDDLPAAPLLSVLDEDSVDSVMKLF